MNMGWKCPGCGKCYSPLTPQCFSCGQTTRVSDNTGGLFSTQIGKGPDVPLGNNSMSRIDPYMACLDPMKCERKDGYCAKCHSEYY